MLRQVLIAHRLAQKKRELEGLISRRDEIEARRAAMKNREEELEEAVQEITEETAEEAQTAVEEAVAEFEQEAQAVEAEAAENAQAIEDLEAAIDTLQSELESIAAKVDEAAASVEEEHSDESEERSNKTMNNTKRVGRTAEQVRGLVADAKVRDFLSAVRSAISEKRAIANAGLLIPEVMLGLVREEVARQSKLLPFVHLRHVAGEGRVNMAGAIPEAVWSEMCANINELSLAFNQTEVDGYKANGYMAVCNAVLEDSDVDLAAEIVDALSGAIAKACDKAILYGTGTKMPVGIVTRLATQSQPAWWGSNEPAWTDLHSSNIRVINKGSASGAEFFIALVAELAIAKPKYSADGLFWVMNRKTHLDIMAKALAFDSAAALVSNTEFMPVVGGTVVEIDDMDLPDYEIIGGFGGNYLMAERAGVKIASSDIPLFLADQTVFKATARYDGRPLCGEAFVVVNYANTSASTTATFPADDANSVTAIRMNTTTASVTAGSTIRLHAITEPGKGTVTWASGTTAKATVESDGTVTGVTAGTSVITASCNGLTATCTVTVS